MNKKIRILSAVIVIILSATGCIMNNGTRVYDNEDMIVKDYNSYNLVMSKQHVEDNCLTGSAQSLEGMGTIWRFDAAEDTEVNLTYRINVSSGKAKLVLISPDDTITTLAECTPDSDGEEVTETFQANEGENRIKLIGAKGTEIEYEISADKGKVSSFGN